MAKAGCVWSALRAATTPAQVTPERERKSVSSETTFDNDIIDKAVLKDKLWGQCQRVADRMKASGVAGRVVTLKLKTDRFKTVTRRRTLDQAAQLADTLFRVSAELLDTEPSGVRYRSSGPAIAGLNRRVRTRAICSTRPRLNAPPQNGRWTPRAQNSAMPR
jgi:DNA polymerase-4